MAVSKPFLWNGLWIAALVALCFGGYFFLGSLREQGETVEADPGEGEEVIVESFTASSLKSGFSVAGEISGALFVRSEKVVVRHSGDSLCAGCGVLWKSDTYLWFL